MLYLLYTNSYLVITSREMAMDYTVSLVTMINCWTLHVILLTLWWHETGYTAPVWRNNTLDLSFPHSGSLLKCISKASQRWISFADVYSDHLSSAHLSHSDTEQFNVSVTTTVVTFLFTLIKDFLLCWCYLSPILPPTVPPSTGTVCVSNITMC